MKRCTAIHRCLLGLFVWSLIGCTDLKLDKAHPAPDAGDPDGGGAGMSGSDAGADGPPATVSPTTSGFATVGQARSGGGFTLRDDGFEPGARLCTGSGELCVTGGFEP